jgi:predicted glycoside hydrolase/deacetylase ChbG (UPF0249 family)
LKTRLQSDKSFDTALVTVHADDMGATSSITSLYLDLMENRIINQSSILANCIDFQEFKFNLNDRNIVTELNFYLHLNLTEGPALTITGKSLITDSNGNLNLSFTRIIFLLLVLNKTNKAKFLKAIEAEWIAQYETLDQFLDQFEFCKFIGVDSHMHIHMLPKLYEIASRIALFTPYKQLRIPKERIYLSEFRDLFSFNYYKGIVKNLTLKLLMRINRIEAQNDFIGVIYSGRMSSEIAFNGIKRTLGKLNRSEDKSRKITVLFHPGQCKNEELGILTSRLTKKWYLSERRNFEYKELLVFHSLLGRSI